MKNYLTELVFILDKSGSMSGLESDTIGGFNSMLKKQKEVEGDCLITTVLFDDEYELIHDRLDIKAITPLTEKEYQIGGTTALLDAIGITINKIENAQKHTLKDYQANRVMFVIITDGQENSSREYTSSKIKNKIEKQKEKYQWEFIFLGANIDAVETANDFGIDANRAVDYHADAEGLDISYSLMSNVVLEYRNSGIVNENNLEEIRSDFKSRKQK